MGQMGQMGHVEYLLRERALQTNSEQVRAGQSKSDQGGTKHIAGEIQTLVSAYLLLCELGAPCWCAVFVYTCLLCRYLQSAVPSPFTSVAALAVPPVYVPFHGSTRGLSKYVCP